MALRPCPDCQHQVSSDAPTCPHCGRPIAGPSSRVALVVILVVIGLIVFGLIVVRV